MKPPPKPNQANNQTSTKQNKQNKEQTNQVLLSKPNNKKGIFKWGEYFKYKHFIQHRCLLTHFQVNLVLDWDWHFSGFFLRAELLLYKLLEMFLSQCCNKNKMYIEHPVLQINSDVCKAPFTWISPSKWAAHFPSPCLCNNSYFPLFSLVPASF